MTVHNERGFGDWQLVSRLGERSLNERRRRIVVDYLGERGERVDVDALASAVSEKLRSEDPELADADRLGILLHHVDLPLLDDIGLVAYDAGDRRVSPSEMTSGRSDDRTTPSYDDFPS